MAVLPEFHPLARLLALRCMVLFFQRRIVAGLTAGAVKG